MKTAVLLRILRENGACFDCHKTRHDSWVKGNASTLVPRHRTIKRSTALKILKDLGIKVRI